MKVLVVVALIVLHACLTSGKCAPTTPAPTTTTTTTVAPTTTTTTTTTAAPTTISTTTTPAPTTKIGTGEVEMCDNGYQPDACEPSCGCPVITFNNTYALKYFPDFVASDGNKTYLPPTFSVWFRCLPGSKTSSGMTCPEGFSPLTIFFDNNFKLVQRYDSFKYQADFNIVCNDESKLFEFSSPLAETATKGYYACYQ